MSPVLGRRGLALYDGEPERGSGRWDSSKILDQAANGTPGDSDDQVFEVQGVSVP
jgi:hypothetical protein